MNKVKNDDRKNFTLRIPKNSPEAKWLQHQKNSTESMTFLISLAIANYGNTDLIQMAKKVVVQNINFSLDPSQNETEKSPEVKKSTNMKLKTPNQKTNKEKNISLLGDPRLS